MQKLKISEKLLKDNKGGGLHHYEVSKDILEIRSRKH
jgi:hypothetical protein